MSTIVTSLQSLSIQEQEILQYLKAFELLQGYSQQRSKQQNKRPEMPHEAENNARRLHEIRRFVSDKHGVLEGRDVDIRESPPLQVIIDFMAASVREKQKVGYYSPDFARTDHFICAAWEKRITANVMNIRQQNIERQTPVSEPAVLEALFHLAGHSLNLATSPTVEQLQEIVGISKQDMIVNVKYFHERAQERAARG